jgi:hypothetical protein
MSNRAKIVVTIVVAAVVMFGLTSMFESAGVSHPGQAAKLTWFLAIVVVVVGLAVFSGKNKHK